MSAPTRRPQVKARKRSGTSSPPVETTEPIYQANETESSAALVLRRPGLSRVKQRLDAPPPTQPGSFDFWVSQAFGNKLNGIQYIESLVAGQGENADEKWVRLILLYKEWEAKHGTGELPAPPTLNQVVHSLKLDVPQLIRELQQGVLQYAQSAALMKAAVHAPKVVDNLNKRASSKKATVNEIELQLKLAGVYSEKGGVQVNVNQHVQTAVVSVGDKERMRAPLLQFAQTVEDIDREVRRTERDAEIQSEGECS